MTLSKENFREKLIPRARRLRREGVASLTDANIEAAGSKGKRGENGESGESGTGEDPDCQLASNVR